MRRSAIAVVAAAMLVLGAAGALALPEPGTHVEGGYTACVNSKSGEIRMVETLAGLPECEAKEYSVAFGFPFEMEYGYDTPSEVVEQTSATHFIECPDGALPIAGGGYFEPAGDSGPMLLQGSYGVVGEFPEPGEVPGWEVEFASPDGLPRSGTVSAWVSCTFAKIRGWGD